MQPSKATHVDSYIFDVNVYIVEAMQLMMYGWMIDWWMDLWMVGLIRFIYGGMYGWIDWMDGWAVYCWVNAIFDGWMMDLWIDLWVDGFIIECCMDG